MTLVLTKVKVYRSADSHVSKAPRNCKSEVYYFKYSGCSMMINKFIFFVNIADIAASCSSLVEFVLLME